MSRRSSSSARASSGSSGRVSGAVTGPCYKRSRGRRPRRSAGGARPVGPAARRRVSRRRRPAAASGDRRARLVGRERARTRVTYVDRPRAAAATAALARRGARSTSAASSRSRSRRVHEAGAAHGALRRDAVAAAARRRPARPRCPAAPGTAPTISTASGSCSLELLTAGTPAGRGSPWTGEAGPAADAAALLEGLLAADPGVRPASARDVAARLAGIAAAVPDADAAAGRARAAADGAACASPRRSSCSSSPAAPVSTSPATASARRARRSRPAPSRSRSRPRARTARPSRHQPGFCGAMTTLVFWTAGRLRLLAASSPGVGGAAGRRRVVAERRRGRERLVDHRVLGRRPVVRGSRCVAVVMKSFQICAGMVPPKTSPLPSMLSERLVGRAVADPHARRDVGRVAAEPGVAEVLRGAGLAGLGAAVVEARAACRCPRS